MPRKSALGVCIFFIVAVLYLSTSIRQQQRLRNELATESLLNWREGQSAPNTNLTVNIVIASLRADDISWTQKLQIPNLNIIRYVSDSTSAKYRPPVPRKGREALIYHTYFHDFYDDLPDLSIMIHAHEDPWHMDGVLQQSMLFALSRLDLERTHERGYVNLRASWEGGCPDRIDTSKTSDESTIQEESYMREAFAANFGSVRVPRFFAGPCCSQFVVTRDTVHRHARSQYKRSMDWLVETNWSDYITGRTWEHMFPWLFRGEAIDCPVESNVYCGMYGICFEHPDDSTRYNKLWQERRDLMEATEFLREILNPQEGVKARARMKEIAAIAKAEILVALERGRVERRRSEAFNSLFKA